jgi:hypothetical protein
MIARTIRRLILAAVLLAVVTSMPSLWANAADDPKWPVHQAPPGLVAVISASALGIVIYGALGWWWRGARTPSSGEYSLDSNVSEVSAKIGQARVELMFDGKEATSAEILLHGAPRRFAAAGFETADLKTTEATTQSPPASAG